MERKASRIVILGTLLVLALVVAAPAAAGSQRNFRAHLAGRNEVPAVDTNAQGQAIFQLSQDGTNLSYKLIVANIDNVFASHIHCAPAGVNGPVGVTLFSGPPNGGRFDGVLAEGTITTPNPGNACGWVTLQDVLAAITSSGAYANVHTNPGFLGGEIRGQIH